MVERQGERNGVGHRHTCVRSFTFTGTTFVHEPRYVPRVARMGTPTEVHTHGCQNMYTHGEPCVVCVTHVGMKVFAGARPAPWDHMWAHLIWPLGHISTIIVLLQVGNLRPERPLDCSEVTELAHFRVCT